MKPKHWLPFLLAAAAVIRADDKSDQRIVDLVGLEAQVSRRAETLACITPQPVFVNAAVTAGCRSGVTHGAAAPYGPHQGNYIKVYVSRSAKQILQDGTGTYPVGTLIIKEKCRDADFKDIELFTAMIKRERGYNPTTGDWEFMVLNRAAEVTASGKIDTCMDCHQGFQRTDYVSRVYLQK